jgi:hypothetical protein
MRKAKSDRLRDVIRNKMVVKEHKNELKTIDKFDIFHYAVYQLDIMFHEFANKEYVVYPRKDELKFLWSYDKIDKLLTRIEKYVDTYRQGKIKKYASSTVYTRMFEDFIKKIKLSVNQNTLTYEEEHYTITWYYTIRTVVAIIDFLLVEEEDEELKKLYKYFLYLKFDINGALNSIRTHYNSGVVEGGVKLV